MKKGKLVKAYARMWPRKVFDIFEGNTLAVKKIPRLHKPGVYVLYRDEMPYYIGKTKHDLFERLHAHTNVATDPYFNFWNYFSVFVVADANYVDEVEGILIASLPSRNRAAPKITEMKLPTRIKKRLRDLQKEAVLLETDRERKTTSASKQSRRNSGAFPGVR